MILIKYYYDYPRVIQEIIKKEQTNVGNKVDLKLKKRASTTNGGFDWDKASQGSDFWYNLFDRGKLTSNSDLNFVSFRDKVIDLYMDYNTFQEKLRGLSVFCPIIKGSDNILERLFFLEALDAPVIKIKTERIKLNINDSPSGLNNTDLVLTFFKKASKYFKENPQKLLNLPLNTLKYLTGFGEIPDLSSLRGVLRALIFYNTYQLSFLFLLVLRYNRLWDLRINEIA